MPEGDSLARIAVALRPHLARAVIERAARFLEARPAARNPG